MHGEEEMLHRKTPARLKNPEEIDRNLTTIKKWPPHRHTGGWWLPVGRHLQSKKIGLNVKKSLF